MLEILEFSFSSVNIIPTLLLCFNLMYWAIVMLGLIDLDVIDIDVDLDVDADADLPDAPSVGWFNSILAFFNLDQIPFMVFLSFLALPMWMLSIICNHSLGNENFFFSMVLLAPVFFVSLFIAKYMTLPFVKVFTRIKEDEKPVSLIGKMCKVTMKLDSSTMGQVEVKEEGTSYLINAKTNGGLVIPKGASGLVISYEEKNNYYTVEPY